MSSATANSLPGRIGVPASPPARSTISTHSPPSTDADELGALADAQAGPRRRLRASVDAHAERRLARKLALGDAQALADVHQLTARAAYSAILGIVRDRGHAEDVHQQTYAEVWRRAAQFDPARGSLLTWVLVIARSRALDHVRRRADLPTDTDVLVAMGGGEDDRAYDDVVDRALIGEALARIPAQERDVLRMRFWDGLSQTEIAERTGQPLGTVKSRMLAGLRNLKLHLEAEGAA
ncbi:MAG: sigma-70 family RNA polymerase sigma factor [Patulibacter minatonensis]